MTQQTENLNKETDIIKKTLMEILSWSICQKNLKPLEEVTEKEPANLNIGR